MHTFNCNYSAPFVSSRKSHLATVKKISKREEKDKMVLCTLQCFCWKGKEWEKNVFYDTLTIPLYSRLSTNKGLDRSG